MELGRPQDGVRDAALLDELLAFELATVVAVRDRVDADDRDVQEVAHSTARGEEIARLPGVGRTDSARVGGGVQHKARSVHGLVGAVAQVEPGAARNYANHMTAFAERANRMPAKHTGAPGDDD
jgi:hypothetical protein